MFTQHITKRFHALQHTLLWWVGWERGAWYHWSTHEVHKETPFYNYEHLHSLKVQDGTILSKCVIKICMYVCLYVCVYVYVCMYVCVGGYMYVCTCWGSSKSVWALENAEPSVSGFGDPLPATCINVPHETSTPARQYNKMGHMLDHVTWIMWHKYYHYVTHVLPSCDHVWLSHDSCTVKSRLSVISHWQHDQPGRLFGILKTKNLKIIAAVYDMRTLHVDSRLVYEKEEWKKTTTKQQLIFYKILVTTTDALW